MSYTSLRRDHCPKCGSMDNLVIYEYDDGRESYHCFTPGCTNHKHSPEVVDDIRKSNEPYNNTNRPHMNDSINIPPVDSKGWKLFPQDLKRGIKKKYLDMFNVLYNAKGKLLGFPYFREPHYPVAIKYRTPDKDFKWIGYSKDPWLFGRQLVSDKRKVLIITEGELDAIAVTQMTDWAAVSIPNGAQGAVKALKYNLKWIEQFEKVYICFDNDEAGLAASEEAMNLLEKGKAYQVILDLKDPCEYLQAGKEEAFKDALFHARCRTTDSLFDTDELARQYEEYISRDPDEILGKRTGFDVLDSVFRIRQEEVTTLYANPTVGKSSVARQMAANWLVNGNGSILYFAFEESPVKWIDKLVQMLCDGDFRPETKRRIYNKYREKIHSASFYSYDLARIYEAIKYGTRSRGVTLVIFDNVTAACAPVGDYKETIGSLYSLFVKAGKEFKHHTLVISHTKRDGDIKPSMPPHLTSAYGSSAVEQFSDNIITFGREEGTHFTNVAIRKQRDTGEVGELDTPLEYDPILKRFKNVTLEPKVGDNGSVEDKEARDNNGRTTQTEDTRTATGEQEEPRVSRRREKDGQVRQQDGKTSPRGDKGGLPKSRGRTNSESDKAIFSRDPLAVELQSRFLGSPAEREEAVHRVQGALERHGQAKVAKPARIPPRQFNYGGARLEPNFTPPNKDDIRGMGFKIRDFGC